jgi:hypothetical protein
MKARLKLGRVTKGQITHTERPKGSCGGALVADGGPLPGWCRRAHRGVARLAEPSVGPHAGRTTLRACLGAELGEHRVTQQATAGCSSAHVSARTWPWAKL